MTKKEWIQQAMLPQDWLVNIKDILDFTATRLARTKQIADEIENSEPHFFDDEVVKKITGV